MDENSTDIDSLGMKLLVQFNETFSQNINDTLATSENIIQGSKENINDSLQNVKMSIAGF